MEIVIRECREEDCEGICRLNCREMGYDFPIEETRRKLLLLIKSGRDKILVAEAGEAVVGYIHACDYDVIYAPHMKNIMGIAVSEEFQRRGIGRALLEGIEKWAKETGACGIRLVSGAARTGAHAFYRSCGYDGGKQQINFKKIFFRAAEAGVEE